MSSLEDRQESKVEVVSAIKQPSEDEAQIAREAWMMKTATSVAQSVILLVIGGMAIAGLYAASS